MARSLDIALGQYSDRGCKPLNQDFHGAYLPREPHRSSKGIAVALADGISSSDVSQVASEAAVSSFLADYYCTSETWSVKQAAQRVLMATNSWLYAQTRQSQYRYDMDRGYVCTFSALILKGHSAHLFHVGDTRAYRQVDHTLEQLTNDHRLWVSRDVSYLSRALGVQHHLELDYRHLPLSVGDTFLLVTDGVYDFLDAETMARTLDENAGDLDRAARALVTQARERGSDDNLTAQVVRVETLPEQATSELVRELTDLPAPPALSPRMTFDGYRIIRPLHHSDRSHVYLAEDEASHTPVVLKTLATEAQQDPNRRERLLMEEWIARRIDSPHVAHSYRANRPRRFLYTTTEYIEGQSLTQWRRDHPTPSLSRVRDIVGQIAKGVRTFHRLEMLHQDLRPDNVLIDHTGTVTLIDFGSTRVAGLDELHPDPDSAPVLGTLAYSAPEYFVGDPPGPRSDLFSLAVITYQLLTGELPYGTRVAAATTRAAQRRLRYRSARHYRPDLPVWVDETLRRALSLDPYKRPEALSEFVYDLSHPNAGRRGAEQPPLMERHPVLFWQSVSLILVLIVLALTIERFA